VPNRLVPAAGAGVLLLVAPNMPKPPVVPAAAGAAPPKLKLVVAAALLAAPNRLGAAVGVPNAGELVAAPNRDGCGVAPNAGVAVGAPLAPNSEGWAPKGLLAGVAPKLNPPLAGGVPNEPNAIALWRRSNQRCGPDQLHFQTQCGPAGLPGANVGVVISADGLGTVQEVPCACAPSHTSRSFVLGRSGTRVMMCACGGKCPQKVWCDCQRCHTLCTPHCAPYTRHTHHHCPRQLLVRSCC
jgi:hypothetical protein